MTRSRVDSVNSFPVSHRCLRLANEPSCYTLNGHREGSSNDITHYHMTFIMEDGRVLVTGTSSSQSVPQDNSNTDPAVAIEVNFAVGAGMDDQLIGKPVAAIQTYLTTAILTDRGDVAMWGYNGHGQLGRGNTSGSNYAVPIDGTNITPRSNIANRHIVKIDITKGYPSASNAIWALAADGTVWGWGNASDGVLAQGNTTNQTSPVQLQYTGGTLVDDAVDIFLGGNNSRWGYIINEDGELWGVGDNGNGQLADGTTSNKTQFVQCTGLPSDLTPSDYKKVLPAGGRTNCAVVLLTDGRVYMAGQNNRYTLGVGPTSNVTTFTEITYPTGTTSVQDAWMAGEYAQTWLYSNDNRLYAVGYNGNGQLGVGNTSTITEYTEVTSNGEVDFGASDGGSAIGTNFTGGYVEYGKWKPIHISAGGSYSAPSHYHCVAMLGNDGHSYSAGYYGGYGTRNSATTRTIFQRHRIPNSAYEVRGVFEDDGGSIADRPHYDNMIPAQGPDREIIWKPAALVSHGYTSQWGCFLRLENGAVYAIGRNSGNKLGTVSTSSVNSSLGWRRVKLELT